MRKLLYILPFAALLLSCAKEMTHPAGNDFTLVAAMPSASTKTVLGPKDGGAYPVLWSVGDRITVNGVQSLPLSVLEAGGRTAVFHFPESLKPPYHVRYGTTVPSVQQYCEGNIRSGYAPMEAVSSAATFTLSHQSCIVALPLSGDKTLAGISLSALDGTPVASGGTVQLTMPDGGVGIASGKTFHLVLRPAALPKGLKMEICSTDGQRMILTAFAGETLVAGKVYEFPTCTFTANAEPVTIIDSYNELKEFASRVTAGEKYQEVRLTADIAVDGSWRPLEGFTGDFDGGGHTVSGLTRAFANELRGCIRNLTAEGNISITGVNDIVGDETVFWAGILANRIYSGGTVINCTTRGSIRYTQWGKTAEVGALCGYAPRGTVLNCVNEASVTVIGDGSAEIFAGGLFGRIYASSDAITVTSCRNYGAITVRGTVKEASIGGIVGNMDAKHTSLLQDNFNAGEITLEAASTIKGVLNIGGIAGYSLNDFSGCRNEGVIHQGASTTLIQNVGGIGGNIVTSLVQECANAGKILLDGSSAGVVRCGGIIGFAGGDSSVSGITISGCTYSGEITADIASHSTIYAKPITGLYSIMSHTETDCTYSEGKITIR